MATKTIYSNRGTKREIPEERYEEFKASGWHDTNPLDIPETAPETAPPTPIVPETIPEAPPVEPQAITPEQLAPVAPTEDLTPDSPYQPIQDVFGPDWKPQPIFEQLGLTDENIFGAVRVKGMDDVYTIGEGGRKETAESYLERFGTAEQAGIVGEVSMEEAIKLGIVVGAESIIEPLSNKDPYEVWAEFRDEEKEEIDTLRTNLTTVTQTLIDQLMGYGETKAEEKEKAKEELGVDEKSQAISDAQKVRNDLYNSYEKLIVDLSHSTMTTAHIGGLQARTRAQRAVEIAPLDSNVLIAQGAYDRAKDLLDDWSADYNEAMTFQMQAAQLNINMMEGELNREQQENLAEAQIKFDIWQAEFNRNLDTQEEVKKLIMMYNPQGAGITISDSWEDAFKKCSPYIKSEYDFEQKMRDLELKIAEKAYKKPYFAPSGAGGFTPTQQLARMTLFENEIDKGIKQLQKGEEWGRVWDSIRRQFPEYSNEEIDEALGGGRVRKEGPLLPEQEPEYEEWGWARKGAYEEWEAKNKKDEKESGIENPFG